MDRVGLLDSSLQEHIDLLKLMLLYNNEMSLLPELYEIFGKECLLKFLDLFSGTTVKVPSALEIQHSLRDVSIFLSLHKCPKDRRQNALHSLAQYHNVTESHVAVTYKRVLEVARAHGLVRKGTLRGGQTQQEEGSQGSSS